MNDSNLPVLFPEERVEVRPEAARDEVGAGGRDELARGPQLRRHLAANVERAANRHVAGAGAGRGREGRRTLLLTHPHTHAKTMRKEDTIIDTHTLDNSETECPEDSLKNGAC